MPYFRDNKCRYPDSLFVKLPLNLSSPILSLVGDFYRCSDSRKSIEKSVLKMDVFPVMEFLEHPYWDVSFKFIRDIHVSRFRQFPPLSNEEITRLINYDSSPGFLWTRYGFKTKADAADSPVFWDYFDQHSTSIRPIWRVVGKIEWLPLSDLEEDKQRTFLIPPFDFLLLQKQCWQHQNESLKNFFWSSYGFCPYYGGVDKMAKNLLRNPLFIEYDVSGWDRKFPLMKYVYEIRNSALKRPPSHLAFTTENTINTLVLLPNGDLIEKGNGNNSGSNDTTSDNIIGHEILVSMALFDLFHGDDNRVLECCPNIFGDDDICSIPESNESLVVQAFERSFSSCGYEFKFFRVYRDLSLCTFLGFRFGFNGEFWYPIYPIGRIAAAFCFCIDHMPLTASFVKCYSLLIMSWGSGESVFNTFRDAFKFLRGYAINSKDSSLRVLSQLKVPTFRDLFGFYAGFESSFHLEVEVEKEIFRYVELFASY